MKIKDIIIIIYLFVLPVILVSISKWLGVLWAITLPLGIAYFIDYVDNQKIKNKGLGLSTYIQDEIQNSNIEINDKNKRIDISQDNIEEMIDMEEYITQKRIIIMNSLHEGIDDKDYQGNIDYDIENGEALQEMLLPYREDYQVYNVIIGASYQEIGDVESAQSYFNNYSDTLDVSDLVAEGMDNDDKKVILLMSELKKLGLTYKVKKSNIH